MRIISGLFRGKKLAWVSDDTTRPTTDRVKENIFNILENSVEDWGAVRVLDLFAGSGQMGIESISRGATDVIFNDASAECTATIKKNLAAIRAKSVVLGLPFRECLAKLSGQFGLVFLDPPYSDADALTGAVDSLRKRGLLSPSAIIVAETDRQIAFPDFCDRVVSYGRVKIHFLTLAKPDKPC